MKKIILIISGLLVGLVLVEFSLHLFSFMNESGEIKIFNDTEQNITKYDSILGWTLVPSSKARSISTEFDLTYRINKQGFRDERSYEPNRVPGTKRVIVFGDSFTFGWGVENNKTFAKVLERETGYDILNFGVFGYDVGQYYLSLRDNGLGYDPDVVIYNVHIGNDIEDVILEHPYQSPKFKPYFKVENGELVLKNVPVPLDNNEIQAGNIDYRVKNVSFYNNVKWLLSLKTVLLGKNLLKQNFYPFLVKLELVKSIEDYDENFLIIDKLLVKTKELLGDRMLLVTIIPSKNIKYNYLEKQFGEKLAGILEERNIPYVNLIPIISEEGRFHLQKDGHFNERGHTLVAEALARLFIGE